MLNTNIMVFMEVARQGSFTKATNNLYMTSTAVMKHINNLEKELGFKLFTRSNQGVTLTDAGEVFFEDCKKIVEQTKAALQRARKLSPASSIIRLGTSTLTPGKPLLDLWNRAYENFPDYQLNIVPYDENHRNILQILDTLGSVFDLLVSPCGSKTWLEHANILQLGHYNVEMAVPKGHPLAAKKLLEPSDFSGETIIVMKEHDSATLDQARNYLVKHNSEITIQNSDYYDIETFNYAIRNHYLMLSLDSWKDIHPSFATIPVNWQYQIPYGIIYSKQPSLLIQEFIETVAAIQGIHA